MNFLTEGQASYRQKLKDRRWLKKRHEILERDNYRCRKCYPCYNYTQEEVGSFEKVDESELEVHHMKYVGSNPWDTPNKYLITLCQGHHEDAHGLLRNGRSIEYVMDWCLDKDLDKYGFFEGTIGEYLAENNTRNIHEW